MSEKIGIIGLGIMGSAYTKNLSAAGYEIIGYDLNEERFAAQGNARVTRASSATDVSSQVDRIITSLPHPDALKAVAEEIAESGNKVIIADTCTLKISDKEKSRDILAEKGVILLDCPVSGTGHQAAVGDLVIFGSGDEASFNKMKPAFEKMGRLVHYLGEFGTGSKMKYIANLLVAIHNVSAAEAITYGIKAGIDPQLVYDVIKSSAGTSRMFEVRGPMMVDGKYDEDVSANHIIMKKDISVILDYADQIGCPTPLLSTAGDIHRSALAQGFGLEDTASVCAITDQMAGVKRK
ncbi:NAD(P)-dependent oxidoreductase [Hyphomicrobiales bacterium]|jgi:putative dehydrogenase|nr:NAD(P)-dependent oxidoreductase [Rhodobiaceae bacterium]MDB4128034.1 NAD(P)-dependent oxidoreductase [Hyphomicrobiales bacterium]MBT5640908.1 NAD(P)-dependent oxidoreductase [Rhodobiaceae bacterium]MBT6222883.1 NAD(P)-dependent oxidoreductase [Rhodobiaceae bacterium]MDB4831676.1 NAD(P)-dependent oxidoreductase [Hyphomicrobiales bacterium]|tara:strand:+ start:39031 stop:39912 length:882 start_codon:yes stop_codon:yes gene_type:complete